PSDHVDKTIGERSIHTARIATAIYLNNGMRLLNAAHARRASSFDDIAGNRNVGRSLVGNSGKLGVALRAVNIPHEQQAASVRGVQVDLVASANVADIDVAAPGTLGRDGILDTPLRGSDNNSTERS